ncbi:IS701 family transposase [Streptomyces griseoflavus]|uniref:IS701 family transposase n=1 Tax=Streptomyces griseoflavus TaxID=35619 RepID=UPI0038077286
MAGRALTNGSTSIPVFTEQMFEGLPRADQRRWAHAYVQGLLTTPGKKSVRRLAATISSSPATSQSLHQFVNASPWDWNPVRAELARWVERQVTPRAWVVDQAVLRKRGEHSCGVHRRFIPSTGRSVTCQVGVGAFLASAGAAVPVDWRLLLPGSWVKDPERRRRARIPADAGLRTAEQHALDLIDTLAEGAGTAPLPVVCSLDPAAGFGVRTLLHGLALRGRDFVVPVPGNLHVMVGRHLRMQRAHGGDGHGLVLAAGSLLGESGGMPAAHTETVTVRGGDGRPMTVVTGFVRLPGQGSTGAHAHRTYRLLAVRPDGERRPAQLWLTSLTHARTESVLALARLLPQAAHAVREMRDGFGLLDFEGRSYPGWHHHMTLVSAAYAYDRLTRPAALPAAPERRLPVPAPERRLLAAV